MTSNALGPGFLTDDASGASRDVTTGGVLLAVDDSLRSPWLPTLAEAVAADRNGDLLVAKVVSIPEQTPPSMSGSILHRHRDPLEESFNTVTENGTTTSVEGVVRVGTGSVPVIAGAAMDHGASTIVLGTGDRSRSRFPGRRSDAERVRARTSCRVVVADDSHRKPTSPRSWFQSPAVLTPGRPWKWPVPLPAATTRGSSYSTSWNRMPEATDVHERGDFSNRRVVDSTASSGTPGSSRPRTSPRRSSNSPRTTTQRCSVRPGRVASVGSCSDRRQAQSRIGRRVRSSPYGPNGKPPADSGSGSVVDGNVPSSETRSPALDDLPKERIDVPEPLGTEEHETGRTHVRRRLAAERGPLSELIRRTDSGHVVDVEGCGGMLWPRKRSPPVDEWEPDENAVWSCIREPVRADRAGRPAFTGRTSGAFETTRSVRGAGNGPTPRTRRIGKLRRWSLSIPPSWERPAVAGYQSA